MTWRRIALVLALAFVAAQLVPVARTNPPAGEEIAAPLAVDGVLQRACYDCHSHETRWPWYAFVAPASWLVVWDVQEGRSHLNFSEWERYTAEKRRHKLEELIEVLEEDEMPLWYYRPLHHPDADVSAAERDALIAWARAERARLRAAMPAPASRPGPRGGAAPPSSAPAPGTP
jgi:hypothetical protein